MIVLWLLYSAALSLLLSVAAWSAERALRLQRRSARWAWAAALSASVALPAFMLLRPPSTGAGSALASSPVAVTTLRSLAELGLVSSPGTTLANVLPLSAWIALTCLALGAFLLGTRQVARERRRWPTARVAGEEVRIADAFGPAVVGVLHPEIVLPSWMLGLDEASLELVLRHEREHVNGRDTLLLAGGYLAAAALAWNPLAWIQLRRLRMAVEVDCDLRVLRAGADRRRYGELLIRVGERGAATGLAAAALTEPTSFLERRIRMMTLRNPRARVVRTLAAAAVAGGALAVACDVPAPTQVAAPPPASAAVASLVSGLEGDSAEAAKQAETTSRQQPAIFVDGVRLTGAVSEQLEKLEPSDIERVEVVKGTAVQALYPGDPNAANGVIYVFTKRGRSGGR